MGLGGGQWRECGGFPSFSREMRGRSAQSVFLRCCLGCFFLGGAWTRLCQ